MRTRDSCMGEDLISAQKTVTFSWTRWSICVGVHETIDYIVWLFNVVLGCDCFFFLHERWEYLQITGFPVLSVEEICFVILQKQLWFPWQRQKKRETQGFHLDLLAYSTVCINVHERDWERRCALRWVHRPHFTEHIGWMVSNDWSPYDSPKFTDRTPPIVRAEASQYFTVVSVRLHAARCLLCFCLLTCHSLLCCCRCFVPCRKEEELFRLLSLFSTKALPAVPLQSQTTAGRFAVSGKTAGDPTAARETTRTQQYACQAQTNVWA